jgi:division/cell wall cluster transcriptional repressor MraZ
MFVGRARVAIDEKNRITLPSIFRAFLEPQDQAGLIVTAGGGTGPRNLTLYPPGYFNRVIVAAVRRRAASSAHPEKMILALSERSQFAAMDVQGRLVLPRSLIDRVGLGPEPVVVGALEWMELWNVGDLEATERGGDEFFRDLSRELLGFDKSTGNA